MSEQRWNDQQRAELRRMDMRIRTLSQIHVTEMKKIGRSAVCAAVLGDARQARNLARLAATMYATALDALSVCEADA